MWLFKKLLVFIIVLSIIVNVHNELISVVQVFRHGQRTPILFYPNDPYQHRSFWTVEPGELDMNGKRQAYELGKFTRKLYDGFLPREYNKNDFYIESTNMDRTLMSAQCNVAGLYQPEGNQIWMKDLPWQPIPIHPDRARFNLKDVCRVYIDTAQELESKVDYFLSIKEKYSETFRHISRHCGENYSSINIATRLYNTLHIEDLNGLQLPNWTRAVYPRLLKEISGYGYVQLTYNDVLKKMSAGIFFKQLLSHFDDVLKGQSTYKLKAHSAHDFSIAAILNSIGAFTPHVPKFTSSIYIELRRQNNQSVIVNFWYKDGEAFKQLSPANCTLDCPFEEFKKIVGKYRIDEDEFETLCKIRQSTKVASVCLEDRQYIFYIFLCILIILATVFCFRTNLKELFKKCRFRTQK